MFEWLISNLATIIISLVLAAGIALIVVSMVKNKKKGKSSCGCGCSSCPMSGACHSKSQPKKKSGQRA